MPIPDRTAIKSDLVEILHRVEEIHTQQVYEYLVDRYQLTPEERAIRRSDVPAFENEVRWARQDLVDDGIIARRGPSGRGYWSLVPLDQTLQGLDEGNAVTDTEPHLEGHQKRVWVNRYERDRVARAKCIAHHGAACSVCGIRLERLYGSVAEGRIHVHHLVPISSVGSKYEIDPIEDLRPVCPNCHFVLHLGSERPYTIEELRAIIEANGPPQTDDAVHRR